MPVYYIAPPSRTEFLHTPLIITYSYWQFVFFFNFASALVLQCNVFDDEFSAMTWRNRSVMSGYVRLASRYHNDYFIRYCAVPVILFRIYYCPSAGDSHLKIKKRLSFIVGVILNTNQSANIQNLMDMGVTMSQVRFPGWGASLYNPLIPNWSQRTISKTSKKKRSNNGR